MKKTTDSEITLKGINASPGICIGRAYLDDREGVEVINKYCILEKHIKSEVKRFKTAVQSAKAELRAVIENSPEALQKAQILETHVLLLNDKLLYGRTIETIEKERVNAEWALKTVVTGIKSAFEEMTDVYLKERVSDIVHVSDLVMRNLVGVEVKNLGQIDKRVILVARDISPADTSQINLERIQGVITDLGGKTSHTGIIARALEIPAVVGLEVATRRINNDDLLIVDGTTGTVIIDPSENTLVEYEDRKTHYERRQAVITRESRLETKTTDGHPYRVMGNIELPEEVVAVINYGGDGIGLYRTEFQYMNRPGFPSENELLESYKDVIEVMAPRPVIIRTLDINGDKALATGTMPLEANPALGLRAIRYCLKRPEVIRTQLRAILRAAAFGDVRILIPTIAGRSRRNARKRRSAPPARDPAGRHDRGAVRGGHCRPDCRGSRFFQHRHQRPHSVRSRDRPRQPSGLPSLPAPGPGDPPHDQAHGGRGPGQGDPGPHVRRNGALAALCAAAARDGAGGSQHELPGHSGGQAHDSLHQPVRRAHDDPGRARLQNRQTDL
jgi:phosphotransferase system enzyme I (PtsI)